MRNEQTRTNDRTGINLNQIRIIIWERIGSRRPTIHSFSHTWLQSPSVCAMISVWKQCTLASSTIVCRKDMCTKKYIHTKNIQISPFILLYFLSIYYIYCNLYVILYFSSIYELKFFGKKFNYPPRYPILKISLQLNLEEFLFNHEFKNYCWINIFVLYYWINYYTSWNGIQLKTTERVTFNFKRAVLFWNFKFSR